MKHSYALSEAYSPSVKSDSMVRGEESPSSPWKTAALVRELSKMSSLHFPLKYMLFSNIAYVDGLTSLKCPVILLSVFDAHQSLSALSVASVLLKSTCLVEARYFDVTMSENSFVSLRL